MTIEEIQQKLLDLYNPKLDVRANSIDTADYLGLEWSEYRALIPQIQTPEFFYRVYVQGQEAPISPKDAFIRGLQRGHMDGFDEGYNAAIDDMQKGEQV